MAALTIVGTVHLFKLKKIGSRRIVYPVHEMGEARREAIIPSAETYSGFSMLTELFRFDKINRSKTRITLITIPVDILPNLVVNPMMELFPGMMIVSG